MTDTPSNVFTLYEFPADAPEKEIVIETLLWALEEVRMGRLCSVALVGVSEDFKRTVLFGEGVRTDHIPHVIGMLSMLGDELKLGYDEALAEASEYQDI